jgi:hypothetical protein
MTKAIQKAIPQKTVEEVRKMAKDLKKAIPVSSSKSIIGNLADAAWSIFK